MSVGRAVERATCVIVPPRVLVREGELMGDWVEEGEGRLGVMDTLGEKVGIEEGL